MVSLSIDNSGTANDLSAHLLSGTNTGDSATNTTSNSYADGKVSDTAYDATSWD